MKLVLLAAAAALGLAGPVAAEAGGKRDYHDRHNHGRHYHSHQHYRHHSHHSHHYHHHSHNHHRHQYSYHQRPARPYYGPAYYSSYRSYYPQPVLSFYW